MQSRSRLQYPRASERMRSVTSPEVSGSPLVVVGVPVVGAVPLFLHFFDDAAFRRLLHFFAITAWPDEVADALPVPTTTTPRTVTRPTIAHRADIGEVPFSIGAVSPPGRFAASAESSNAPPERDRPAFAGRSHPHSDT